jgi:hypothetical protein
MTQRLLILHEVNSNDMHKTNLTSKNKIKEHNRMTRKERKFKTSQKLKMLPNVFKTFRSGHSELDLSG